MKQEWENQSLVDMFEKSVEKYSTKTAVVSPYGRLSYRELDRLSDKFAKALSKIGIQKNDKVGFLLGNTPEWIITTFGVLKLGAILVPLNLTFQNDELDYAIRATDISTLIVQDEFRGINYKEVAETLCPELKTSSPGQLESEIFPKLKNVIVHTKLGIIYENTFDFYQLLETGYDYITEEMAAWRKTIRPEDIAYFMLTSGSTARPKVAMNSHNSFVYVAACHADAILFTEKDRFMGIAPNYHNAGTLTLMMTLLRGGEYHIIDFFAPEPALEAIEKGQCNVMFGFDIHLRMMAESPRYQEYDFSSMKRTMLGSNPAAYDLIKGMGVTHQGNIYGCTEGASTVCVMPINSTKDEEILKYSHGRPLPWTEVVVKNPGTGERCKPNEPGELCFKGPNLFSGYYKNEEATQKDMDEEGFFHTGDYGWMDENGYVYYRGRFKQMVKTGGENVSQREVELFLEDQCPWVKVAQVVGVPDEKWGEAVTAVVELVPGERVSSEELREWCKGKIAKYKIPKHFIIVAPNEWPVTPTGKFNKFEIRKKAMGVLGIKG